MRLVAHTQTSRTRATSSGSRAVGLFLLLFLLIALLATTAPDRAEAAVTRAFYTVTGRGFGHGVGMSQYGAQGYATKKNWKFRTILTHYYSRTTIGTISNVTLRVLLRDAPTRVSVKSTAASTLYDERTRRRRSLTAGQTYSVAPYSGRFRVRNLSTGRLVADLVGPVRVLPGSAPIRMLSPNANGEAGLAYRGFLRFGLSADRLRTVNHLPVESYLKGVVPAEMPASWHAEALKAQAVAARSYAIAGRRRSGDFDLYATARSQYYGAVNAERTATNRAIVATAGLVVKYSGSVIPAFFHSTSGGMTENIEHVWGGSALGWAKSVVDPYDTVSPYHIWHSVRRYTPTQLDAKLGSEVKGFLTGVAITSTGVSPRVKWLRIGGTGGTSWIRGSTFKSRLALRSTWFGVRAMSIGTPSIVVRYGQALTLSGRVTPPPRATAGGVRTITFRSRRVTQSGWTAYAQRTSSEGRYARGVRPVAHTFYQTLSGQARTPRLVIHVRAVVSLRASSYTPAVGQRILLSGGVSPNHAAKRVSVTYYSSGGWRSFASPLLSGKSTYSVPFKPAKRGTYYFCTIFSSDIDHWRSTSTVRTVVVR